MRNKNLLQWEYDYERFNGENAIGEFTSQQLVRILNERGKEGWEFCFIINKCSVIFKRQIKNNE